jgi:hypothetical protein
LRFKQAHRWDYNVAESMPFFFILPVWQLAVVASLVVLLAARKVTTRRRRSACEG